MTTVYVDVETHARLDAIARQSGFSVAEIVAEAVRRYDDDLFWSEYRAGYARIRADPELWSDWTHELHLLDGVASDGLT